MEVEDTWWRDVAALAARLERVPAPSPTEWYRIGDGYLEVRSADGPFRARLRTLFREAAVSGQDRPGLPRVSCTVRGSEDGEAFLVTFQDPEPLDQLAFTLKVFPDRGYAELPGSLGEWRMLGVPTANGLRGLAFDGASMLAPRKTPWQGLAGNLAVNRLFRLQRDLLFLHAGSVGIHGRGCLLIGPKGSGKTTLSLALAARGHPFLGDEIAGVRLPTRELVPVRRSLAVRDGPRAEAIGRALDTLDAPYEPFPDGSRRQRSYAAQLFPGSEPSAHPLRHLVFLRGFDRSPRLESFSPGRQHIGLLTPMAASLWGRSPARQVRDLLALVTGVGCAMLWLGEPDETAECLANWAEE